jgi:general secretion pathway protein B
MSFILDALKKSENQRQRQTGPSLADITVIRRRNERPWWAFAVGALLALNLLVLLVVLMRNGDAKPTAPVQQQQVAPAPQPQTYSAPAPTPPPAQAYQPPAPTPGHFPTDPSVRSLADEADYEESYAAEPAAAVPAGPPKARRIEPPTVAPLPAETRARVNAAAAAPADSEVLPTANDLAASGTNLPELHLDIHVHSRKAGERFVFVNMRKYQEGETLKEGPTVERITADGVILNQRGLRFLLPRQ